MGDDVKTFEIKCLKCNTAYRIPRKYCGENILCDNCGVIFIVPTLEELIENLQTENPVYEKVSDETVKINRKGLREIEKFNYKAILQTSNFIIPPKKK